MEDYSNAYTLHGLKVLEIEALQSSSNKLNEERIFDLKQRIEDLMMERDTFNAHNKQQKKEISSLRYLLHLHSMYTYVQSTWIAVCVMSFMFTMDFHGF